MQEKSDGHGHRSPFVAPCFTRSHFALVLVLLPSISMSREGPYRDGDLCTAAGTVASLRRCMMGRPEDVRLAEALG